MKIYVSTCDKYMHLMSGFAHLFNKYWGSDVQVDVLGFTEPAGLPCNFNFNRLEETETRAWTTNLRDFFSRQPDHHFVFLLDDYWLTAPVDLNAVSAMEKLMYEPGVVKADLSLNSMEFGHVPYRDALVQATVDAQYRTSTQPCIWSRKFMLDLLTPGLNPWEFELQKNCVKEQGVIVGSNTQIYKYANVCLRGMVNYDELKKISSEDMAELNELGAIKPQVRLPTRPLRRRGQVAQRTSECPT